MMVTIEHIRRKGNLCYLTIAGRDEIAVIVPVAEQYALRKGLSIPQEQLDELVFLSDLKRAHNYVTYLLSRRGYSVGMITQKLQQKGYTERVIKPVVADFMERDLLNDLSFARSLVESMLARKPAGKRYLAARLQKSFIPRSMAEKVVEEFLGETDETELAVRLLRSRWRYLSKFELETARRKAYNYLSRRAIGYRAAKLAFEKMVEEESSH